jgi:uncharacterized lipoprotein YajG
MPYLVVLFAAVILAQGCMPKPQMIKLDPIVRPGQVEAGTSKTIGLEVVDIRPDQKLGIIGDPDFTVVDAVTVGDSAATIYKQVAGALARHGFEVKRIAEFSDPALRVEIKQLKHESVKRLMTFEMNSSVVLVANAKNADSYFNREYWINRAQATGGPLTLEQSSEVVNGMVSEALSDMVADKQLLEILAR